jgi:hypothetical protein
MSGALSVVKLGVIERDWDRCLEPSKCRHEVPDVSLVIYMRSVFSESYQSLVAGCQPANELHNHHLNVGTHTLGSVVTILKMNGKSNGLLIHPQSSHL